MDQSTYGYVRGPKRPVRVGGALPQKVPDPAAHWDVREDSVIFMAVKMSVVLLHSMVVIPPGNSFDQEHGNADSRPRDARTQRAVPT